MDSYIIGAIIGIAAFLLGYVANTLHRLDEEIRQMATLQKLLVVEQAKTRQFAEATLQASETFVDALRQSAEMMGPPGPPNFRNLPPNTFDDLRQSFENGIRGLEEEDGEEDGGLDNHSGG